MDMNDIVDVIIPYVDVQPINLAIKQRAEALAGQMNPEAAEQFVSEMKAITCSVTSKENTISFKLQPSNDYLIEYLKNHGTPVSGGENGTVHDVDGSTYESLVPEQLQGTELPWLELPTLDGEDEAWHIAELMASDAAQNAVNLSKEQIAEQKVKPYIQQELSSMFGGD